MSEIAIEQARFRSAGNGPLTRQACSPGFPDGLLHKAASLCTDFGLPSAGLACFPIVFAQPLGATHVAAIQVGQSGDRGELIFHILSCSRTDYEQYLGDPFALARHFPALWAQTEPLPTLTLPRRPLPARTAAQLQEVLRRVKAGALKENEDPEHPDFQRNADNSESPALLGGVQVLVDGGKLVFERPRPDAELLEGLWTLLPQSTRASLWPATFAFNNRLGFDVLVVPKLYPADFEGYTSEEQAAEYPAGSYEVALQIAAEAGNQRELDALLNRRSSGETFRLGWTLLVIVVLLALAPGLIDFWQPRPALLDGKYKAAAAVGMIATGDPWTALGLKLYGDLLWSK